MVMRTGRSCTAITIAAPLLTAAAIIRLWVHVIAAIQISLSICVVALTLIVIVAVALNCIAISIVIQIIIPAAITGIGILIMTAAWVIRSSYNTPIDIHLIGLLLN